MLCQTYLRKVLRFVKRSIITTTDLSPSNPDSHWHMGPSRLSIHCPPFWHGFSLQKGPIWHLRSYREFWAYSNYVSFEDFIVKISLVQYIESAVPLSWVLAPAFTGVVQVILDADSSIQAGVGVTRTDLDLTVSPREWSTAFTGITWENINDLAINQLIDITWRSDKDVSSTVELETRRCWS